MLSLADVKAALRIDPDQDADDALLIQLEAAAVAYCGRITGRYFGPPSPREEVFSGVGQTVLWLADSPTPQTEIAVTDDDAVVDPAWYRLDGRQLIRRSGWWGPAVWERVSEITVAYTAGYAEGAAPADVQQAVRQLVALWFELGLPVALGTVAPPVPHGVHDLLAPYRIVRA